MSRIQQVCVLGGGGFVGRTLVQQLADSGRQVTVLSRRPERRRHLLTTPGVKLVKADVHQKAELVKHFAGMDAAINLIGILNEFRYQKFRDVHVKLPSDVMRACWKAGVPRLLHMSALNADAGTGMSEYLRTKGEAEQLLHVDSGDDLQVTRFRPSVIFGPHDQFFNRFATLLKYAPWIFPLAAGKAKLSPVYVGDVAQAFFLGMAPGKPFTLDNYHSLQTAGACKKDGLQRLGIDKTPVEAIVPSYLIGRHERARYDEFRRQASRDVDWF